ncbi:hypothetical protein [Streptomyces palmae]|uniref:Uncharacterized protein n=1 Tax=Streptomyces palmae TaxID=1701085 RepID=A0A4Z0HG22_9ACTN|nr:hypothetical protein [Streptomyces palmae]TGB19589.1 hypothetical protein E4099_00085 [Streptomyces palmae]
MAQTRPGVRIVLPWGRLGHVALTVADDHRSATGWVQGLATFMGERAAHLSENLPTEQELAGTEGGFDHDLAALQDGSLLFAVRVVLPDVHITTTQAGDGITVRLHDGVSSRAVIHQPAAGPAVARQAGPRRLADEVGQAWRWWEKQGRSHVYDFGMTVRRDGGRSCGAGTRRRARTGGDESRRVHCSAAARPLTLPGPAQASAHVGG